MQQQKETNLSYRRCKQVNNPLMGNSHNALSVDLDDPVPDLMMIIVNIIIIIMNDGKNNDDEKATDLMMTSFNMIIIIMNDDNNNNNDDDMATNPDSSTLSDSSSQQTANLREIRDEGVNCETKNITLCVLED